MAVFIEKRFYAALAGKVGLEKSTSTSPWRFSWPLSDDYFKQKRQIVHYMRRRSMII
jgi:hypothetical protein